MARNEEKVTTVPVAHAQGDIQGPQVQKVAEQLPGLPQDQVKADGKAATTYTDEIKSVAAVNPGLNEALQPVTITAADQGDTVGYLISGGTVPQRVTAASALVVAAFYGRQVTTYDDGVNYKLNVRKEG